MKQFKKLWIGLLATAMCLVSACSQNSNIVPEVKTEIISATVSYDPNSESETMQIHFIDVGQGDATLVTCGGEHMLIDAGENDKGTLVQNYLQKNGVETLKYAIGTHPHSDHIGGLDVIITKFDVENVMIPKKESDTRTYDDVIQAMKYKNMKPTYPNIGDTYSLGSATFTILSPGNNDYGSNLNNYSIAILLENGNTRFVFSGDAETAAEYDILNTGIDITADVYHAGHHGSKTSSDETFVRAINPSAVVISCSEGNDYGHPHAGPMNLFRLMGIDVYRTDEDGTIIATSNGKTINFDVPASSTWQVGEASGTTSDSENIEPLKENEYLKEDDRYVLNTNTLKFHLSTCASANKISEQNKEIRAALKEDLINQGYSPCGICNP